MEGGQPYYFTITWLTNTHWRQSRKDVPHSGNKNYSLSTKSTDLNMAAMSTATTATVDVDKPTINRRQSRLSTLSPVLATVNFVASVYRA